MEREGDADGTAQHHFIHTQEVWCLLAGWCFGFLTSAEIQEIAQSCWRWGRNRFQQSGPDEGERDYQNEVLERLQVERDVIIITVTQWWGNRHGQDGDIGIGL